MRSFYLTIITVTLSMFISCNNNKKTETKVIEQDSLVTIEEVPVNPADTLSEDTTVIVDTITIL